MEKTNQLNMPKTHLRLSILLLFLYVALPALAQRLVVGITVDQMRWDALHRYEHRFTKGGFKRLMREGTEWTMCQIPYLPAVTAVGHASIYTGAVPAMHGIVSNSFTVNGFYGTSVVDTTEHILGGSSHRHGASPRRLLSSTIGDELRMASAGKSRVISMALKDRAAILPGGHGANLALWWDEKAEQFISSSYYGKSLPQWVKDFNAERNDQKLLAQGEWPAQLMYPADTYLHSRDTLAELPVGKGMFATPWGATLTLQLASRALQAEQLGQRKHVTDMLCISISSTDAISHNVGPDSPLMEDVYLWLDRALEQFFIQLDRQVGKGQWLCFLTADHAGQHTPRYREINGQPALEFRSGDALDAVRTALTRRFGAEAARCATYMSSFRMTIDEDLALSLGLNPCEVIDEACRALEQMPMIQYAFDVRRIPSHVPAWLAQMNVQGYHPGRIGTLAVIPRIGVSGAMNYNYPKRGTSHALWTPDDTHIPLLMMGANVPRGKRISETVSICDIAPTICQMLNIQQPSAATGRCLLPL